MRALVGDFFEDVYSPETPLVETQARTDFKAARQHAISLIRIHDSLTGAKAGRPRSEFEALKRSALILSVTAWESFVEDTVEQQLDARLNGVTMASQVESVFNSVAQEWLASENNSKRPTKLMDWTGDSWKSVIRQSLSEELERFHTPKTENVDKLFKRYLKVNSVSKQWHWQGVAYQKATNQLNALIELRGRSVHRGMRLHPMSQPEASMRRATVVKALNLIYNLVDVTEKALGIEPRPIPQQPPP